MPLCFPCALSVLSACFSCQTLWHPDLFYTYSNFYWELNECKRALLTSKQCKAKQCCGGNDLQMNRNSRKLKGEQDGAKPSRNIHLPWNDFASPWRPSCISSVPNGLKKCWCTASTVWNLFNVSSLLYGRILLMLGNLLRNSLLSLNSSSF